MQNTKNIDKRRYTKERMVAGRQEFFDSQTNQWLLLSSIPSDSSGYHSHHGCNNSDNTCSSSGGDGGDSSGSSGGD